MKLNKTLAAIVFFLGILTIQITHTLHLSQVPGFHFDEAWAALFSRQIAVEHGFWPFGAMSPYTSAWAHYLTALYFKLYGTNLTVYRLCGITSVVVGVICLAWALMLRSETLASLVAPWLIAFFPVLVVNDRFVIEINTFHTLCFGVLCGLLTYTSKKREIGVALTFFLGITSHILFIAVALALYFTDLWFAREPRTAAAERAPLVALLLALMAFFIRIAIQIPEHDKSFALIALCAICLGTALLPLQTFRLVQKLKFEIQKLSPKARKVILTVVLVPPTAVLLFFIEGSWSEIFFSSHIEPLLIGWILIPVAMMLYFGRSVFQEPKLKAPLMWFALTTLFTLLIATKPAPRYFEIPLLMSAILLALAWARCPLAIRAVSLALWCLIGSAHLYANYFMPILNHEVRRDDFHFLVFRDSSNDTLPKQEIAQTLGSSGCDLEYVQSSDPRIMEPLKFLAIGDWPLANHSCEWAHEKIVRKIGIRATGKNETGGAFVYQPSMR